ncbi:hypothetical protein L249_7498 [Ophiocordyceps polyrhachis-furcata BCC 54312]|uniref:Cyclin-dependent kinase n=1 Tax=Ophiocordyceps polyrhachis-furcata BCC 54312 TaxID=1330021 RepID=A0A367L9Q6_9HYPO|nr:hypothetical protein L249_7498 [Ophiocordyceps polyrhachis-furcata BCC 54312]
MASSPWKKQPEDVVDSVLKRAQVSKMARRLQNRLALAQFKAKRGWEDLTLDSIEPKLEEEIRRKRLCDGDVLSDSSSSASDLPYPTRTLMSSPLKPPIFSDAVGSSNGSSGTRKRTYFASSESPKRFHPSSTAHKSSFSGHATWKDSHQLAHSSPIKPPRRLPPFTTSAGPDISFFKQRRKANGLKSPNLACPSDDDGDDDDDDDDDHDDRLPAHSFASSSHLRSSPPRTPPMQTRRRTRENAAAKSGEEGADLLLFFAASPSAAVRSNRGRMEPLTTPPPKNNKLDLPSSMMTTPGGGNPFSNTPGQGFDFADFVNITPSPAQKQWRTPVPARTPLSVARRRLTFEE